MLIQYSWKVMLIIVLTKPRLKTLSHIDDSFQNHKLPLRIVSHHCDQRQNKITDEISVSQGMGGYPSLAKQKQKQKNLYIFQIYYFRK